MISALKRNAHKGIHFKAVQKITFCRTININDVQLLWILDSYPRKHTGNEKAYNLAKTV